MSYWGATVITNLFSAIPFIGTDIVQFINLMIKFNEINYENINFYYSKNSKLEYLLLDFNWDIKLLY